MKYFIDTEFIEDFTRPLIGKPRHYIDLISIAIVAEDGCEYYAVSKEFDIDHVWNKFQWKEKPIGSSWHKEKEYWLRDNVLMPIVFELAKRDYAEKNQYMWGWESIQEWLMFIKRNAGWERIWKPRAKELIKKYGKSNKQITTDILEFIYDPRGMWLQDWDGALDDYYKMLFNAKPDTSWTTSPEFYGYYADYDWVLFCSLYGRMLDLPKGFPMYCRDLKQMLDQQSAQEFPQYSDPSAYVKEFPGYPKQSNSHNALDDARWNKKLFEFLQTATV